MAAAHFARRAIHICHVSRNNEIELIRQVRRDLAALSRSPAIDFAPGASKTLAQAGYELHAVATLRELLDEWRGAGAIKGGLSGEPLYARATEIIRYIARKAAC